MARRLPATLTRRGRWFAGLGLVGVLAGVLIGQRDVLRVAVLVLALPAVSVLAARGVRVRVLAARVLEPPRVAVGRPATIRLRLQAPERLRHGVLLVEDTVPPALGARPRFVLDEVGSGWRHEVTYRVRADARGHYRLGPLAARVLDPFGLVETRRTFGGTTTLTVTPAVVPLPDLRLRGAWSGSGESRPRSITASGEEDVTLRPYARGDDVRRVHWRSTAHHGELMVRREEQPWQSRCTLVLDTRLGAFVGDGPASSFEWAVSAAASVAMHLMARDYAVRLVTDDGAAITGTWLDPGIGVGTNSGVTAAQAALLDALAVVRPTRDAAVASLRTLVHAGSGDTGLVVAVLGRLQESDARQLARLGREAGGGLALLLDVDSWAGRRTQPPGGTGSPGQPPGAPGGLAGELDARRRELTAGGWHVTVASRGDRVDEAWLRLRAGLPAGVVVGRR
jgi:uncharacterized protein (DUF58 family)